jgi:hypothetical protein
MADQGTDGDGAHDRADSIGCTTLVASLTLRLFPICRYEPKKLFQHQKLAHSVADRMQAPKTAGSRRREEGTKVMTA